MKGRLNVFFASWHGKVASTSVATNGFPVASNRDFLYFFVARTSRVRVCGGTEQILELSRRIIIALRKQEQRLSL